LPLRSISDGREAVQTTVTSDGSVTLPIELRWELGIDPGTVLNVERVSGGAILLRKRAQPGFFDQFAGLKAEVTPFTSGDEAREALR
jgi:AbrB family looped-hinge helix DNA binding protein